MSPSISHKAVSDTGTIANGDLALVHSLLKANPELAIHVIISKLIEVKSTACF